MGKVISFKDHVVKEDGLTVGQHIAMYHYAKWKIAGFRQAAAEKRKRQEGSQE